MEPIFIKDNRLQTKQWGWLLFWGLALIVLGIMAISMASLTTLISIIFLGSLLFIGGIVIIFDAFKVWWNQWSIFSIHCLLGILYISVGLLLWQNPLLAMVSLTLMLGIMYLALGIFRIIYAFSIKLPTWGFNLFNGIVSFFIGLLILLHWPQTGLFIIGLFIGIDLICTGWVYLFLALAAKNQSRLA